MKVRRIAARFLRATVPVAATLVIAAGVTSCNRQESAAVQEEIAARIGDSTILVREVEEEIAWRVARGAIVPARETLLQDMIERRLLVQKAMNQGLEKDPEVRRGWENLLISRYKEEHLRKETAATGVTEEEILSRYESNSARFRHPAKARLAILQASLPSSLAPDQREETLARMQEARSLALESADAHGFGTLAARYSEDDVTRHRGGDTGWLDENVDYRWPAEVIRAGFALAPGAVGEPIVCGESVYLVRKLDERPSAAIPLAQVRDSLRREIHTAKLREIEQAFASSLREGVRIDAYPDSLAGIRIPVPEAHGPVAIKDGPPTIP